MILGFLAKNYSSSLAIILDFLGEYLIPLAKVELKVTIDKGFNGQSCFDSPDMGDVERLKFEKFKEKVERSRGLKIIRENYQSPIFF